MSDRIKIENIHGGEYNRQTGAMIIKATTEYVCSACRRFVNEIDKFCFFCGAELMDTTIIEHYSHGKQLTDQQYNEAKILTGKNFTDYIKAIPEPLKQKGIP